MHIAIDGQGNTYVAGFTRDTAYPTTPGAYVPPNGLGNFGNGFITKYNANTSAIVYSTYIGGSLGDAIFGVAVDPNGNAYITGSTESDDYPVTTGALKTKLHSLASDTTLEAASAMTAAQASRPTPREMRTSPEQPKTPLVSPSAITRRTGRFAENAMPFW